MTYFYKAYNIGGTIITGQIQGDSKPEILELLGTKGLIVISLVANQVQAQSTPTKTRLKPIRIPMERLAVFTRQMATMLRAGLPLLQCFHAMNRQAKDPAMTRLMNDLTEAVEQGNSFSESLERHPQVFNKLYVSLVKAGEAGGQLFEMLHRLASYLESTIRLRKKIRSAMAYPVIVCVLAIAISLFMILKIIPVFVEIYKEFDGKLPTLTVMVIGVSNSIRANLLSWMIGTCVVVFVAVRFLNTKRGRWLWDKYKLRFPIIGSLAHKISLARFSRTCATLMRGGVPILIHLPIVGRACGNVVMEAASQDMANAIEGGQSLTQTMEKQSLFPAMMQEMVSAGEKTGNIPEMLEQVADYYDDEIETTLSALTSMIEPLLIAFLGVVLGTIVVAMFLPILKISEIVQF